MIRVSLEGPLRWAVSHPPAGMHSRSSATILMAYSWPSRRAKVVPVAGAATTRDVSSGTVRSWTVTRYCRPTLSGVKAAGSQVSVTWGPFENAGSARSDTGPGTAVAAAAGRTSAAAARSSQVRWRDIAPMIRRGAAGGQAQSAGTVTGRMSISARGRPRPS